MKPACSAPEPLDVVVARVRGALAHVDPARLWLAPDCGLMTIGRDLARAKARLLVAAAEAVRNAL